MNSKPTMSHTTDFPPKPMKKIRPHKRKLPRESQINMAEARRQIAQALQLHRSSLSSSFSTTMAAAGPSGEKPIFPGSQHFCYSILESMPLPQPTWSTTAPCVLRCSPLAAMEEQEVFEWGDYGDGDGDVPASYAWWLGFLKTLDVNNSKPEYPNAESGKAVGMGSLVLTQCQDGLERGEALFLQPSDHSSFADEWLIVPITEDGFIDNNCLGNDFASN